ncbi:PIG-L deacetylase family protein [Paenibacillus abyssi]|uniref:GlcNAc-PI de-N-acetylase n=1 Tax=Paenibacillus abyssi TaxID=1340531 RepID=A0A917FY64_9BACL|nr:PIG-L deacetylase family protein [Paenibacillus abyssi]GGG13864.1 GlcNAc-PI de-N-acetylase [Paenibacillus abyssi]
MNSIDYNNQRVLVLAPHADDETLGCGGVLQKYLGCKSPVRVVIACFTLTFSKRYKKEIGAYSSYQGNKRIKELQKAMQILGVDDYHILYQDQSVKPRYDSKLDTISRAELVDHIERHITDFCPTVIFIPSITKHQDHEALHQAAVAAARPYFWNGSVYIYETDGELSFTPNLYVSLTKEEITRKLDALKAYVTQLGSNKHPVNEESIYYKAKFRGNQIYEEFAEAFQILRLRG